MAQCAAVLIFKLRATVDIKSLHTPVKMSSVCDVKKNETKINHFRTFSTFNETYELYNSVEQQTEMF